MYFRKLTGEKCYLSPMTADDAERYTVWLNDPEVTETLTMASYSISAESEREILARLGREHNYSIIDRATDQLIGSVGLLDVNQVHQSAEIGIFIGDKSFWGRGYGREALSLLLDYAFMKLNLNSILLRVYGFNHRAMACYRSVGFRKVGVIREGLLRNRKRHSILLFDLLPRDFYRNRKGPEAGE